MPGGVVFQVATVSVNSTFRVDTNQPTGNLPIGVPAEGGEQSCLQTPLRITIYCMGHRAALEALAFQKPLLIAKYGISASSAKPGRRSLGLNTASTLQFLIER